MSSPNHSRSDSVDSDPAITKFLDELSNRELAEIVRDQQLEMRRIELENKVFENFLASNEPSLIACMAQVLEVAKKVQSSYKYYIPTTIATAVATAIAPAPAAGGTPTTLSRSSAVPSDAQSATDINMRCGIVAERGPRINISQKTDLVMREIEAMQISLKKFLAYSHRRKCNLRAEIEETTIRAQEVKDSKNDFEESIVIGAVQKLTQKIPAEKFVWYMQEWLKSAHFMLEKLRLRTSSLRIQQAKLKNLLTQKEELGECVHEVDFEKLRIENKNFQHEIEQKNGYLVELKRINGKGNLMLTNHKNILQKQDETLKNIKRTIKIAQKRIIELEEEEVITQTELDYESQRYSQLKKLAKLYQVPDVMEYIKKKAELNELKRNLKIWRRKRNIQKSALSTYTKMMMHITGHPKAKPSWYDMDRCISDNFDLINGEKLDSETSSIKLFED